jgi:hypothetical protein
MIEPLPDDHIETTDLTALRESRDETYRRTLAEFLDRGASQALAEILAFLCACSYLRGYAQGLAKTLLKLLEVRRLLMTTAQRDWILEYKDVTVTLRMLERVRSVGSVDELLEPYWRGREGSITSSCARSETPPLPTAP